LAITWPYTNRPYHRHTNAKFRVACGEGFSVRERIATRVLWSINNLEVLRSQLRTKRNLWEIYYCNESGAFSLAKYYWMASITEKWNTIKRPRRSVEIGTFHVMKIAIHFSSVFVIDTWWENWYLFARFAFFSNLYDHENQYISVYGLSNKFSDGNGR